VVNPIVAFALFVVIVSSATAAAAQGQPKSPQESCKDSFQPTQCLATRELLGQLRRGDRSARWTYDFSILHFETFEDTELLSKFRESAQAAPPDEYCRNVKEQKQCLATRAVIAQIKAKDQAARWSDDVLLVFTQNRREETLLVDFWLAVTPPPKPPEEYCGNAAEQKQCLATRTLLAQLIARDKAARWSSDIDYAHTRHDVEATILFNFRIAEHLRAHGLKPR
jgi:hypothetical protein